MATVTIKEQNRHSVQVDWVDPDGNPTIPTTVRWRVDCLTTRQPVIAWTSITAAQSSTIEIPSSASAILNSRNSTETKRITVQANASLGTQVTVEADWTVENSPFVT